MSVLDWLPTFLDAGQGSDVGLVLDGESLLPLLPASRNLRATDWVDSVKRVKTLFSSFPLFLFHSARSFASAGLRSKLSLGVGIDLQAEFWDMVYDHIPHHHRIHHIIAVGNDVAEADN